MKIVVTGSLGNVSKHIVEGLQKLNNKGQFKVVVVTSKAENAAAIEALGATAAVGEMKDAAFMKKTFSGADRAYVMLPPGHEPETMHIHGNVESDVYFKAISAAKIPKIILLSTFGADLSSGTSDLILAGYRMEKKLQPLSKIGTSVVTLRPTAFYYNLLGHVSTLASHATFYGNIPANMPQYFVSPKDIASAALEEIVSPTLKAKVRYIVSEQCTATELAAKYSKALGKGVKYVALSSDEYFNALTGAGVTKELAQALVDMYACIASGIFQKDLLKNYPTVLGVNKLQEYIDSEVAPKVQL